MPKRAAQDPDAQGIYLRKKTYWLRNPVDGVRYFQNLHTHDFIKAVEAAKKLRGIRPQGKPQVGTWEKIIEKYIAEKLAGVRPAHLAGRRLRSFRTETAPRVRSCLKVFASRSGAPTPAQVTTKQLQSYYESRAKKSEAGARSTMATIQAFLEHIQCLPGRVVFSHDRKPEVRLVVVPVEISNGWIEECQREDLKYVLFCGFHAGLRRGEIMHSRISWFDRKRRVLTIPGKERQTLPSKKSYEWKSKERQKLPSGKSYDWKSKDGESREIPLSSGFSAFLETFLAEPKRDFCLLSKKRSASGLFDFRAPFQKFMKQKERPDVTRHAMRHSWITELCNSGNHSITEIAAWSGDTVETIETNYWKKRVRTGGLDDTMAGKRSGDALKEVAATLKTMSTAGLDKETTEAIKKLLNATEKSNQAKWEWTDMAPDAHVQLHSVEDTINNREIFGSLFPTPDGDSAVTAEDWDEGFVSTPRSRLMLLEKHGWIRKVDAKGPPPRSIAGAMPFPPQSSSASA